MSSSKNQSSIMIGIGLMVIAIVIIVYSLNLPKVADVSESTTAQTSAATSANLQTTVSSADTSSITDEISSLNGNDKTEKAREAVTNSASETETNSTPKASGNKTQSQTVSTNAVSSSSVAAAVSYPINLNTCTAEELMSIENVGESRANAIIEYRDYLGGYTSVEQLKDIKGIGDATFAKIEPYVTV